MSEVTPEQVPDEMVNQMLTLSDMAENNSPITEDVARSVIAEWLTKAQEMHSETVECPECFAVVYRARIKAHEYWHGKHVEPWHRDPREGST